MIAKPRNVQHDANDWWGYIKTNIGPMFIQVVLLLAGIALAFSVYYSRTFDVDNASKTIDRTHMCGLYDDRYYTIESIIEWITDLYFKFIAEALAIAPR